MTPRDKSYRDGYHWGIKGKNIRFVMAKTMDKDWWAGYEDGHADLERIKAEGTLTEQLEASLKWFRDD